MLLSISFISALAGVGFAGAAALLPGTGIDGTPGAFLALVGAGAVAFTLGLLVLARFPTNARRVLAVIAALLAMLTALAAWFLMQDVLLVTMVVSFLAKLVRGVAPERKTIL